MLVERKPQTCQHENLPERRKSLGSYFKDNFSSDPGVMKSGSVGVLKNVFTFFLENNGQMMTNFQVDISAWKQYELLFCLSCYTPGDLCCSLCGSIEIIESDGPQCETDGQTC